MRRTMAIIGLVFSAAAFCDTSQPPAPSGLVSSGKEQAQPSESQKWAGDSQGKSQDRPIYVEKVMSASEKKKADDEAKSEDNETTWNRRYQIATIVMAFLTAALAFFTLKMWLEGKNTARRQLRAYLTVKIADASYQERGKNIKFEARPVIVNCGVTPAHDVGYWADAAILSVPLPATFTFPRHTTFSGSAVLGPKQEFIICSIVPDFMHDDDVVSIKAGHGRALYMWGAVIYKDIFGENRETQFCHQMFWREDGAVMGWYNERHNKAT